MVYILQAKKLLVEYRWQNGIIFEEVGISQLQIGLLKNPLFSFSFVSKLIIWYSYYRPNSCQFATHYLII